MNADSKYHLVTGAGGFVGAHMVELLRELGHTVIATDKPESRPSTLHADVPYVPADLTDFESLVPVCEGIDVIFNPASIFHFSTPREVMERVNVGGVENLCAAAAKAGIGRMVHWSTMMIFGDTTKRDSPIIEDTPRFSNSIYGSSKIRQEDVVLRYCREGKLPATVVRPAIVYGPRSEYGLADIVFKARHLPVAPVITGIKSRICLVHVRDVVGAAYHLSGLDEAIGECYNLCDDRADIPMRDMFTLLGAIFGKLPVVMPLPKPVVRWFAERLAGLSERFNWMKIEGRPVMERDFVHLLDMDGYASNEKLRSSGYELEYPDWRSGLVETCSWYKEQKLW